MASVNSEVFPNLRIDSSIKSVIDPILLQLKNNEDPIVKKFADAVSRLDYQIENGSPPGVDACDAYRDSSAKVIKLPVDIVGSYKGSDGINHPITLAQMLIHELSHAASDLDFELPQNHDVMMHLMDLKMQAEVQGKGSDFPTDDAFEVLAVQTENFITARVFNNNHPRNNVTDKGLNFTLQDLKQWSLVGYPVEFECQETTATSNSDHHDHKNVKPSVEKGMPLSMAEPDTLQTRFLGQIDDMNPEAKKILLTQFHERLNQQSLDHSA